MAEYDDGLPESQLGRAQWLADNLALCGHEDITAIDILDALASISLKLVPDTDGISCGCQSPNSQKSPDTACL